MAKLSVLIGGDDRELQAALRRAQSSMLKFGKELRTGINDAVKYSAALAGVGAAIATHMVKQSLDAIDAQAKMASALTTTVASMATLQRAADLDGVSVQQLETGVRKLATVLGESVQGTGTAVESLKRLKLSADELAALPLDQRLALINQRIRENIPLTEQAAVSADFFGERAGVAMLNLNPATLAEAAEEARIFGTALSEVDAKQVELANDSMSRISLAMDGFWRQVAVRVAPALKMIGDEFFNVAKEAGGMDQIATNAMAKVVAGAGFVADSVDGVRRVFLMTADAIVIAMAGAESAMRRVFALQLKIADMSTLGFSDSIEKWAEENNAAMAASDAVIGLAMDHIQETLMQPMPSESIEAFWQRVQEASKKAAEEVARARGIDGEEGGGGGLSRKEQEAMAKRLEQLQQQFETEDELSILRREKELEDIAAFEEQKLINAEEAFRLRQEVEQAHWDRIGEIHERESQKAVAIEKARNAAITAARNTFMSNLAGLMNTQSRKVFEFGKNAAIAEASVKGAQAVMDAWQAGMSTGGPWAPFIAAAYAAAAGINAANLINNIRSQQFGGGGSTPTAPTQGASGVSPQGAGGGAVSAGGGGGGPTTIVNLQGETFGREQVRNLLQQINEDTRDGGRILIA